MGQASTGLVLDLDVVRVFGPVIAHEQPQRLSWPVADRVVFIAGRVIVEQGPRAQVIGNPSHERTRAFLPRVLNPATADDFD